MSVPGLHFTAIDFETANGRRGSACAVGLIKVRDGQIVDSASTLLRPIDGGGFNGFNIGIHGIRPADVVGAPTWAEYYSQLQDFVGTDALVAHNAPFDRSVWNGCCQLAGIAEPTPDFYCTVRLARRYLDLPSAKLPLVVQALQLPTFKHHDATADAQACAQIAIELGSRFHFTSIGDLGAPVGQTSNRRRGSLN